MIKSPNCRNFVVVEPDFGNFDITTNKMVYDADSDSYVSVSSVSSLKDWLSSKADLSARDFDLTNLVNSGVDPRLSDVRMRHSRAVDDVENVVSIIEE